MSALVGVRFGACVVRQNTGISHAGWWRRRSELLLKQRQQLIKTSAFSVCDILGFTTTATLL